MISSLNSRMRRGSATASLTSRSSTLSSRKKRRLGRALLQSLILSQSVLNSTRKAGIICSPWSHQIIPLVMSPKDSQEFPLRLSLRRDCLPLCLKTPSSNLPQWGPSCLHCRYL
jgi:hypothetical protein